MDGAVTDGVYRHRLGSALALGDGMMPLDAGAQRPLAQRALWLRWLVQELLFGDGLHAAHAFHTTLHPTLDADQTHCFTRDDPGRA